MQPGPPNQAEENAKKLQEEMNSQIKEADNKWKEAAQLYNSVSGPYIAATKEQAIQIKGNAAKAYQESKVALQKAQGTFSKIEGIKDDSAKAIVEKSKEQLSNAQKKIGTNPDLPPFEAKKAADIKTEKDIGGPTLAQMIAEKEVVDKEIKASESPSKELKDKSEGLKTSINDRIVAITTQMDLAAKSVEAIRLKQSELQKSEDALMANESLLAKMKNTIGENILRVKTEIQVKKDSGTDIKDLEAQLKGLETNRDRKQAELDSVKNQKQELRDQKKELKTKFDQLKKEIEPAKKALTGKEKEDLEKNLTSMNQRTHQPLLRGHHSKYKLDVNKNAEKLSKDSEFTRKVGDDPGDALALFIYRLLALLSLLFPSAREKAHPKGEAKDAEKDKNFFSALKENPDIKNMFESLPKNDDGKALIEVLKNPEKFENAFTAVKDSLDDEDKKKLEADAEESPSKADEEELGEEAELDLGGPKLKEEPDEPEPAEAKPEAAKPAAEVAKPAVEAPKPAAEAPKPPTAATAVATLGIPPKQPAAAPAAVAPAAATPAAATPAAAAAAANPTTPSAAPATAKPTAPGAAAPSPGAPAPAGKLTSENMIPQLAQVTSQASAIIIGNKGPVLDQSQLSKPKNPPITPQHAADIKAVEAQPIAAALQHSKQAALQAKQPPEPSQQQQAPTIGMHRKPGG